MSCLQKVNVTIWTPADLANETCKERWSLIQSITFGKQMEMNLKEPNFIIVGKSGDDQLWNLCGPFLSMDHHLLYSASHVFGNITRWKPGGSRQAGEKQMAQEGKKPESQQARIWCAKQPAWVRSQDQAGSRDCPSTLPLLLLSRTGHRSPLGKDNSDRVRGMGACRVDQTLQLPTWLTGQ